jgi:hypothetical protein
MDRSSHSNFNPLKQELQLQYEEELNQQDRPANQQAKPQTWVHLDDFWEVLMQKGRTLSQLQ